MNRKNIGDAYMNAKQCGHNEPLQYLYTKDYGDEEREYCDIFLNQDGEFVTVFCCDIHGS